MKCRACDSGNLEQVVSLGYRCLDCGSISDFRQVAENVYKVGNYAPYKISFIENIYIGLNSQIRVAGLESNQYKAKAWLDIGCGKGDLLRWLDKSCVLSGVEPEDTRAKLATEYVPAAKIYKDLEEVESCYDVISAYHVLEHFEKPDQLAEFAARHLNPKGVLIVEVPNFSSFQAIINGSNWPHWDRIIHRTHFSEKGIRKLFGSHGFHVYKTSTLSLTEGILGMTSALIGLKDKEVYFILKGSFLKKLFILPLIIIAGLVEGFSCIFKRGGVSRFYLERDG